MDNSVPPLTLADVNKMLRGQLNALDTRICDPESYHEEVETLVRVQFRILEWLDDHELLFLEAPDGKP